MATWCAMVHSWCQWKRFVVRRCDLRFESYDLESDLYNNTNEELGKMLEDFMLVPHACCDLQ